MPKKKRTKPSFYEQALRNYANFLFEGAYREGGWRVGRLYIDALKAGESCRQFDVLRADRLAGMDEPGDSGKKMLDALGEAIENRRNDRRTNTE